MARWVDAQGQVKLAKKMLNTHTYNITHRKTQIKKMFNRN